jgi:two-component system chemotaxis sensor kinase CheA
VVKPLGRYLKDIDVFAGATIMGDGLVSLILDVRGLAQRAHVLGEGQGLSPQQAEADEVDERSSLLVFADREGGRMAIPLELIERLEEYPTQVLETSGVDAVVQYGDEILHLVDISSLLVERRRSRRVEELGADDELLPVLIYRHEGRSVGIVVGQILDIVRTELADLEPGTRPCVAGTLILHGRATELLDLPQLIEKYDEAEWAALTSSEETA